MKEEIVQVVRDVVGPVAAMKKVLIVRKLPKTRSGKIARNTIAAIAAGKPFKVCLSFHLPATRTEPLEGCLSVGLLVLSLCLSVFSFTSYEDRAFGGLSVCRSFSSVSLSVCLFIYQLRGQSRWRVVCLPVF